MNNKKKFALILVCIFSVIIVGGMTGVKTFVQTIEDRTEGSYAFRLFSGSEKEDPLLITIQEEAAKRKIAPIDAVIDRVWKAIPGYNGREVDIEGTYQKAKDSADGTEIQYIYKQIKPRINLEDLEPQPIYRGNSAKPMVAFMINVAWGNEYIVPMLDTLDKAKIKATFFLDGSWLNKNTDMALEIQKRGHQIENHAYSHPNMSQLDDSRARLEISKTKDLLKEKLGVDNTWFAPPSGDFDAKTVSLAAEQGLKTVLWTVDTVDWRNPTPSSVVTKISNKVEAGSLILMHPTSSSSQALQGMIDAIQHKGLKLGTVNETLSTERVE